MSKLRSDGVEGGQGVARTDAGLQAEPTPLRDLPEEGARPAPLSEERCRSLGMNDIETKQALCEHEFGTTCYASFLGCYRTCVKCGAMIGLGRHCAGSGRRQSKGDEG
jgi:hypothetical protein